jgi:predicted O-linked N-acetylglucosamine transferase (SPINDLY family)
MGEKKRRLAAAQEQAENLAAAQSLHAAGRLHEAQQAYREILRADPANAQAWFALGMLARATGARTLAAQCLAKAVAHAPQHHQARMHYAAALQDLEDFDAAIAQWRAVCAARPADAVGWESLGIAEQAAGNMPAAVQAYERAIALDPTPSRRVKLATAVSPIPASRAAIAAERERMQRVLDEMLAQPALEPLAADPLVARLWTNFYLAYHGEDDRDLQQKTAQVYRRLCPALNHVAEHCRNPSAPDGRIRVGLISQFFRVHSIGRTSRGLFAQLSREPFEVTAIFIAPVVDDEISRAIRADADRTLIVPRDLARAQRLIGDLQLDVLFYQDIGMEPFTYFLSYARLAAVQCVSFGHPDTTGVSTVDYFVSNDLYESAGAEAHYSEQLFLLRNLGSLAYYYRPQLSATPKTRAQFGLPTDRPLYLCPQNLFKVHPDMDELIARILRQDSKGIVVLVDGRVRGWSDRLRARWRNSMGDVLDRIVFVPRMREADYLALLSVADVILDTLHFNGMNTSLEALAVGTPIVTLPASFQRGRHTQAMYRRMGLDDLVAADADAYVDMAVKLANDADFREAVRTRILAANGVLFEDARVVREFERFFQAATTGFAPAREPSLP